MERIQRTRRLTPEEVEQTRRARNEAEQEIADAVAANGVDRGGGPRSLEDVLELRRLVRTLQSERQRQSLSLPPLADHEPA